MLQHNSTREARERAASDEQFGRWLSTTAARPRGDSIASLPLPRRQQQQQEDPQQDLQPRDQPARGRQRSVIRDGSLRAIGSLLEITAIALHGDQRVLGNDRTMIQHLSSAVAQSTSKAKLDTVNFSFADRAAAW